MPQLPSLGRLPGIPLVRAGRAALLAAALLLAAGPALGATITVGSTADTAADDGACTLREAIAAANTDTASGASAGECAAGDPGLDTVAFAIPGAGPHTLVVPAALPVVTSPLTIDGYTQPGATANSLPIGGGSNAVLRVVLSGGGAAVGLRFGAGSGGSSVRGLQVVGFTGTGILAESGGGLVVAGNFLGTDGVADLGNGGFGVDLFAATGATIGGNDPADVNVIAGNDSGIRVIGSGHRVLNNLINTSAAGSGLVPGTRGIEMTQASGAEVRGNVIGGSASGIRLFRGGTTGNVIAGNRIGVGLDGSDLGGPGASGVQVFDSLGTAPQGNLVGGSAPGEGNLIAHWGSDGVAIARFSAASPFPTGITLLGNEIRDNGGLAIKLADFAAGADASPDVNDPGDADDGPNRGQNFPVVQSASWDGTTLLLGLALESTADDGYRIEVFHSPACDPSGHGEAASFLGAITIPSIGPGGTWADPAAALAGPFAIAGGVITATATNLETGDTSELSACTPVTPAGVAAPEVPALGTPGWLALAGLLAAAALALLRGR